MQRRAAAANNEVGSARSAKRKKEKLSSNSVCSEHSGKAPNSSAAANPHTLTPTPTHTPLLPTDTHSHRPTHTPQGAQRKCREVLPHTIFFNLLKISYFECRVSPIRNVIDEITARALAVRLLCLFNTLSDQAKR